MLGEALGTLGDVCGDVLQVGRQQLRVRLRDGVVDQVGRHLVQHAGGYALCFGIRCRRSWVGGHEQAEPWGHGPHHLFQEHHDGRRAKPAQATMVALSRSVELYPRYWELYHGSNGYSWADAVVLGNVTSHTFPAGTFPADQMTYFKVTATNAGVALGPVGEVPFEKAPQSYSFTEVKSQSGVNPGHVLRQRGLVVARQHPATAKGTVFVLLEDEFGYMNVIVPRPLTRTGQHRSSRLPKCTSDQGTTRS